MSWKIEILYICFTFSSDKFVSHINVMRLIICIGARLELLQFFEQNIHNSSYITSRWSITFLLHLLCKWLSRNRFLLWGLWPGNDGMYAHTWYCLQTSIHWLSNFLLICLISLRLLRTASVHSKQWMYGTHISLYII